MNKYQKKYAVELRLCPHCGRSLKDYLKKAREDAMFDGMLAAGFIGKATTIIGKGRLKQLQEIEKKYKKTNQND